MVLSIVKIKCQIKNCNISDENLHCEIENTKITFNSYNHTIIADHVAK